MTLGPFLFLAPFALVGLVALPVIWWILRATPPMPKEADLPSLRLLDGLDPRDETPARTPWWILLIRMAAAALAVLGLAQPIYAPGASRTNDTGALLIVVDDGWTSADRWSEILDAARGQLTTSDKDRPIHLLSTAPRSRPIDPAERLGRADLTRRITSLTPVSWDVDHTDALARLDASGLEPNAIFWATDGLERAEEIDFADALSDLAPLTVFAALPRGGAALTGLSASANGVVLNISRARADSTTDVFVSALSVDGAALATATADFEPGGLTGQAHFALPPAALARINRFQLTGRRSAGAVWLWDSASRRQRVGLVSDAENAQPLLSDLHYVRRALAPFANLEEGNLSDLIASEPDAIVLTDIGAVPAIDAENLRNWVNEGGALIRFAGPALAGQNINTEEPDTEAGDADSIDDLVPVRLRRSSRALGGALAWDEPQAIGEFPDTSPFSELAPPIDTFVRQQVLARPAPDLDQKTWARLVDGSPLITAEPRGAGTIVLFHVTAGPDWSDLPYSGVFVDLLRRSIIAGRGRTVADESGVYAPSLVLDGFGQLHPPDDIAAPLEAAQLETSATSEIHPPGYYDGPAGSRALNAADGFDTMPVTQWPANTTLLGDAEIRRLPLAGLLLGSALLLLAIDLIVALSVAGRLPLRQPKFAAALTVVLSISAVGIWSTADAQQRSPNDILNQIRRTPIQTDNSDQLRDVNADEAAAIELRLAYVVTPDAELNEITEAGLNTLSRILFLRTSVEPGQTIGLDLEADPLELYPFIYYAVPDNARPLSPEAAARLNAYLRSGGALIIDTRRGRPGEAQDGELGRILAGLDAPPLVPTPRDHVLTRSFYLLDEFQGRFKGGRVWIDASGTGGDGVSSLFVGDADWAGAWATDSAGRELLSVDGGAPQREQAYRFGVNLIMYVLTGNYKADQVHLPILLERLGEDEDLPLEDPEEVQP